MTALTCLAGETVREEPPHDDAIQSEARAGRALPRINLDESDVDEHVAVRHGTQVECLLEPISAPQLGITAVDLSEGAAR